MITYGNGIKEKEEKLMLRCVGMGRYVRKQAAVAMGMHFEEYQRLEQQLLKPNGFGERLRDSRRNVFYLKYRKQKPVKRREGVEQIVSFNPFDPIAAKMMNPFTRMFRNVFSKGR